LCGIVWIICRLVGINDNLQNALLGTAVATAGVTVALRARFLVAKSVPPMVFEILSNVVEGRSESGGGLESESVLEDDSLDDIG
jgi:hypothetical protein